MKWALLAVAIVIVFLAYAIQNREDFTDPDQPVKPPCSCTGKAPGACKSACTAWESKVQALAPTNAVTDEYIAVLSAFYTTVYDPARSKPIESQIDAFLATPAGTVAGVDNAAIKRILMDAFHIESSSTAAQNEVKSQNFKPSDTNLAPKMGVDEVRTRQEQKYKGANPASSTRFSEGDYAPVTQSDPLNPGQWEDGSTLWKGPRPASVCPCAENVM
jgi:hypothetical protein